MLAEKEVHDLIMYNSNIKNDILDILNANELPELIHEDTYINNMVADFTLLNNNRIRAIIEVKGGNINVTDYVRGIGQIFQYEYFFDKKISIKGYEYDLEFSAVLLYPSSVIKNNEFNIGKFKYPEKVKILELNEETHGIREIDSKELKKLEETSDKNMITVSQYYIRDTRIYELFILLKYVSYLKILGEKSCDIKTTEINFLRKLGTHNNRNWRNAFISLSSLGFLDSKNMPTAAGLALAGKEYEEFAVEIFNGYLKPYFVEIFSVFNNSSLGKEFEVSNVEIYKSIKEKYKNRDVLFLTESKGRYISSWLNIFRDDYGCLDFSSRSSIRKINFIPHELNDITLKKYVKENSKAYDYIEKYYLELKKNGGK